MMDVIIHHVGIKVDPCHQGEAPGHFISTSMSRTDLFTALKDLCKIQRSKQV